MSKVADSIRRGLEEAVAYAGGKAKESAYRVEIMRTPRRGRDDRGTADRPNSEAAAAVAVQALSWLAGEPPRLSRFLDVTGLAPDSIRTAACEPHFLASVLEYLLQDEQLLVAFAADAALAPPDVERARQALAGAAWERETP